MKKIYIVFGILSLAFFVLSQNADAQVTSYYVATNGSDSNSGTLSSPFKTISKCISVVSAGGSCIVRGGTYNETVSISKSGTASAPITLAAYPSEKPVIDGTGTKATLTLTNANNFVVDGLTFLNSSSYASYSNGSSNVTFKNCEVGYPLDGGLIFRNASNILVDNCNVHHTNWRGDGSHEATSFVNIDGFEIKNSQVHDSKEEGIDGKYGSKNGKIHNNVVYGNGGPNIYIDAASNIDVYDNHVYGTTGDKANIGLAVEVNSGSFPAKNIRIFNNILRNSPGGVSFWVETGAEGYASFDGTQIYNNLFYGNTSRGGIRIGTFSGFITNSQIKNNIFKNNSSTIDTLGTAVVDYNLFDVSPKGTNAKTTTNFGFIDEANYNFHLNSNSPAVNAGTTISLVANDFDNNPRPQQGIYDLGPFEFVSNQPPSATATATARPTATATVPPTIAPTTPPTTVPTTPPTPVQKAGDADGDTDVDLIDFELWRCNFLKTATCNFPADFDNNLIVDGIDYVIWALNFGK